MAKIIKDSSKKSERATAIGDELLSYELAFVSGLASIRLSGSDLGAELRSPLLDRRLHPRGVLKLSIKVRGVDSKTTSPGFVLEAFQIESIAEYLRSQERIKSALEARIRESAADFEVGDQLQERTIWQQV